MAKSPNHPRRLLDKLEENGLLGISDQWNYMDAWYNFLDSEESRDYPMPDALNEAWGNIQHLYEDGAGESFIDRGKKLSSTSGTPLSLLFYFIEMGFYPPPELLLTLLRSWEIYEEKQGEVTLEEAFLGKSVKKSGNYSKRRGAHLSRLIMSFNFERLLKQGASRSQAAEAISIANGGKPEPESLLRMFRGIGIKKAEK